MAQQYCGLDVSPTSLKAVILEESGDSPVITSYDSISFDGTDEGASGEGEINPGVREGLKTFSSRHDLEGTFVSASLPTHTTFNRSISLPPVGDQRAEEIIQYEAQQHIPFPLDNVIWDYQKIDRDYEPDEEIDVVLFAIKKDIVNEFLENLNAAEIDVDVIQFAPVALYNFIQYDQPVDKTTAVLDLGKNNCDLVIIEGDRYWIRDVPIAANDFTEALKDKLQVPFEKAEKLKRKAAQSSEAKKYYKILQPVYRDLIQEIHRSIGFYKSKSSGSQIEQIYLTGGGAKTLKLKHFISENMQLDASILSSLERVELSPDLNASNINQTSIGPAVGLGLQGMGRTANEVNLVPERIVREKELQRKKPYVVAAIFLFALAVGAYYFSLRQYRSLYQTEKTWANEKQAEIEKVRNRLQNVRKKSNLKALKKIAKQSVGIVPDRQLPVRIWERLLKTVPDNLQIRNKLNKTLEPFYRMAGDREQDVPGTYEAFREANPEDLPQKLRDVQTKARKLERRFLFLLDVDFHYEDGNKTMLDVYCAVARREPPSEEYAFVKKTLYDPIQKAFKFEDLDRTGPTQQQFVNLSSLTKSGGQGSAEFGPGTGTKAFRVYRVHFEGKTSDLKKNGGFASDGGAKDKKKEN